MRTEAVKALDRVDRLEPGGGQLEAFAFGRGDLDRGMFGGAFEYGHRVTKRSSIFARAEAGYRYGIDSGFGYQGLLGYRLRF